MSERHEFISEPNPERERELGLARLIEQHLPDDKEFILEMDFEEALDFVYGQLLAEGKDPDELLKEFGVTED